MQKEENIEQEQIRRWAEPLTEYWSHTAFPQPLSPREKDLSGTVIEKSYAKRGTQCWQNKSGLVYGLKHLKYLKISPSMTHKGSIATQTD